MDLPAGWVKPTDNHHINSSIGGLHPPYERVCGESNRAERRGDDHRHRYDFVSPVGWVQPTIPIWSQLVDSTHLRSSGQVLQGSIDDLGRSTPA